MAELLDFQQKFRANRIIRSLNSELNSDDLTLFLGLYNAEEYLESLEHQLMQQSDKAFRLLMVDNSSTDSTWEIINRVDFLKGVPKLIVKNPVNLGFHGSLAMNLDLITTTWLGFMNQDDFYLADHVHTLNKLAETAPGSAVILSSGLGSIAEDGKVIQTPPRASWMLGKTPSQIELIVANVAQHVLPEPSIAYRTNSLKSTNTPWHSTAFPDTELALAMLTKGQAVIGKKETVLYRESAGSASHHLSESQRIRGSAISLLRFLTGPDLSSMYLGLALDQKEFLVNGIINSLKARFGDGSEFELCTLSFLENLVNSSNYSDCVSLAATAEQYMRFETYRAYSTLGSIARFSSPEFLTNLGFPEPTKSKFRSKSAVLAAYQSIFSKLPTGVNRFIGICVMNLLKWFPRYSTWKFKKENKQ